MPTDAKYSKGVVNALMRQKNRDLCPGCGFPMPVYPGRYPSKCPSCGHDRVSIAKPQKPEQDAAEEE